MKKNILFGLGLCLCLVLGALTFNFSKEKKFVSADYPVFNSLEDLKNSSPIIIVGSVKDLKRDKDVKLTQDGSIKSKFAISDIVIEEVIKGDVKSGELIKLKQSEEEETAKKVGYFKKNGKYILFLTKFDDIDPNIPASLMNPMQGQIEINKNNTLTFDKDNVIKGYENYSLDEFLSKLKSN